MSTDARKDNRNWVASAKLVITFADGTEQTLPGRLNRFETKNGNDAVAIRVQYSTRLPDGSFVSGPMPVFTNFGTVRAEAHVLHFA